MATPGEESLIVVAIEGIRASSQRADTDMERAKAVEVVKGNAGDAVTRAALTIAAAAELLQCNGNGNVGTGFGPMACVAFSLRL